MSRVILRRRAVGLGLGLMVLFVLLPAASREPLRAQLPDPCVDAPVNPIACENSKPGNPSTEWDIAGSGSAAIQGFATDISVNKGGTIGFKVSTTASSYRIDIYRLGYYAGSGARLTAQILNPTATSQPACISQASTGLVDCGNWSQSASWTVPAAAVSGIYLAKLTRTDGTSGASHVAFVVRDDAGQSDLLFQTSDTTWHAYNTYGGNSLYVGSPVGRAYKVSYNRPFTTRANAPEDWVFNAEYPMVRWLEANGYNVSYSTGVDSDRRGAEILEHKIFLSVGHDEYWSGAQRANVEAARAAGVHLAFFSGNEVFWKTRWENSIDGSNTSRRTLVSYKETHHNAKIDPVAGVWTGTWRDPRFSPPDDGGRPENALTGTIFTVNCCESRSITVPEALGKMRFWRNTTVATLASGATATLPAGVLGYEWDEDLDNGFRPAGLMKLSSTTANVNSKLLDYGSNYASGQATHSLTLYRHSSGALVFGAGTVQWSWGLDSMHDRGSAAADTRMRQATVNLFADMGVQASTLQSGLTAAVASNDTQRPTTTITAPAAGATLAPATAVTITGSAADAGGIVAAVEISVDGGLTWKQATGRASWSYSWTTPSAAGAASIQVRAIDDTGNMQSPVTTAAVTIAGGPGGSGGLVAAFNFNEGSGTLLTDVSGSFNNGTLSNATWTAAGRNGGALTFNGTNAVVTVADSSSLDLTTAMTLEAWVRPTTLSDWETVILKERPGGLSYALYSHDGTRPSAYINTGNDRFVTGVAALVANTWTHLATTYDGSTLRLFVNGALVSSTSAPGAMVVSAGALRLGGNSVWGEYFAGQIDDVRVYSRALSAAEVATDMNTPVAPGTTFPDTTPPAASGLTPAGGAIGVSPSAVVSATFNEPMNAATLTASTFELRQGTTLVPASVSYTDATRVISLQPASALAPGVVYTATLRGGATDPRVKDVAGNALAANVSWSFTTAAVPANEGPGGPILVVGSVTNPFGRYYQEILRNEGFNLFTVTDISTVTAATLTAYDVVVLGEMSLTGSQVTLFTNWVNAGGNLIAMRPDKQLAGLLGLTDANQTLAEGYLLVAQAGPGAGIVNQTVQYHGVADRYTLNGASALATLYSTASTATANPAVSLRSVGASGGQAAAFTYDLARSIVYTRQGNPAWAGQERDGVAPIRSDDMFFGTGGSPDWVDLNKVAIPQADEQQRLLANMIIQMNADRKPLPRFWYLPRMLKAAVVMTGDDHGNNGTAGRFDGYLAASPAGCNVANWECIRGTSYIYPTTPLTNAQATSYVNSGFEIAAHPSTNCVDYTPASLAADFTSQLAAFASKYTGVPAPNTNRTHCVPFSDWASQPLLERTNGIRLDTNYYYWPGPWVLDRPGHFTGSGMPMRFADLDGTIIDTYQAATQMTDESDMSYALHINSLLDKAIGAEGYYAVVTANMHHDAVASAGADAIIASAQARGVPVVSARQMLNWLDGRNGSSFGAVAYSGTVMTFTITAATGSNGLHALLPAQGPGGPLTSLTRAGSAVGYTLQTIKGVQYAVFAAAGGSYTASYVRLPDTAITSAPATSTTATGATFTFSSDPAGATFQCSLDGSAYLACATPTSYTGLALGNHTFAVRAVNGAGTDPTPATFAWTIGAPVPPDTTLTGTPAASTTSTSATFTFTSTPAGATFQCSLDAAAYTACTTPQAYAGLAVGNHTFGVRAVNAAGTDATPATFAWTITAPPPSTGLVAAYGFEEGAGTTTADLTGGGKTGTLANATWSAAGRFGRALSFNGSNAMVTIADANALDLTSAMTLEAWVRPTVQSGWRTVLLKETTGGLSYGLYGHNGSRPSGWIRVGSNELGVDGTAALAVDTWAHLAMTFDGANMRLYVNGVLVATRARAGSVSASTGALRIGGNSVWGEYFSGLIDEVRIYSRVLTAAEITTDMNAAIQP